MEDEENENLRTLECLRGRLLAERQISRSAKEEAELITMKVTSQNPKFHSCLRKSGFDQKPRKSTHYY